jgi:hypothetical protein
VSSISAESQVILKTQGTNTTDALKIGDSVATAQSHGGTWFQRRGEVSQAGAWQLGIVLQVVSRNFSLILPIIIYSIYI